MISRSVAPAPAGTFFLLGPRGVGKSAWLRTAFPGALVVDLLDDATYLDLLADPRRLGERVPPGHADWVVVDEIQRAPKLLDEVRRLAATRRLRFVLTGSSARTLRRHGGDLPVVRAPARFLHPLTAGEIGAGFDLRRALRVGCLPAAWGRARPNAYLADYAATYLREEVQQEGIVRDLGAFTRFLEAASLAQGEVLNRAEVARACGISAKVAGDWFDVLEDLLLAVRVPVFAQGAKRRLVAHPKFYFFDAGVYRAIRPRGPLDEPARVDAAALETLLLEHLRAANGYANLGYAIGYWRTAAGDEVDFVLHGDRGLVAFDVKATDAVRDADLRPLRKFRAAHPHAKTYLLHLGQRRDADRGIEVVPFEACLRQLGEWL